MEAQAMIVGYARTSTADQVAGIDAQERDLRAAGCEKVFREQVSSVGQRDQLAACLAFLREGDVLVVAKPDRLARNTESLLGIVNDLTARGVGVLVQSMGGVPLDTRNPTSKLMLTILAGVATWEREIMLERQREGIKRAQAEGKYKGGQPTVLRQREAIRAMAAQGQGATAIAAALGIGRSSVYRMLEDESAAEAA
jgi:DNA invertase Pin-like site-specific DNA recombinase